MNDFWYGFAVCFLLDLVAIGWFLYRFDVQWDFSGEDE